MWIIGGQVQGVGYRPFVFRLAHRLGLRGWVRNLSGQVEVIAQGDDDRLEVFAWALLYDAPPLARPLLIAEQLVTPGALERFTILDSVATPSGDVHLPPDYFACDDCLAELRDPGSRRYRYPFINCTQCGPRYTLIDALPYDRPQTAMAGFALCPACRREYLDSLDRRFHAQPLACPECGPSLTFHRPGEARVSGDAAVVACIAALRRGMTVAVKGVGGYHLLCDARSEAAVRSLRRRKHRPHKPMAVMVPWRGDRGLDWVNRVCRTEDGAADLVRDPARPIVLMAQRTDSPLAPSVAPGLDEVGVMLPYSPLHHLLLDDMDGPLVATSANIGGEPVLTDGWEIEARLAGMADAFLHHDRPIRRPADDSVYRIIAGRPRPLRLGRGHAPLELTLPTEVPRPTLAVGAHLKNTVALAWGRRVVVSPHVGDLGSPRSAMIFERVIKDLREIYKVDIENIICDAHPGYTATRWARASGLPVTPVYHHHAHAAALTGEHGLDQSLLVFTWDGTGLGDDGTLWGGEALLGRPGHWRRCASFRPFTLPGGDKAIRQPWRTALSLTWEAGAEAPEDSPETRVLHHAWRRGLNCPRTSSVGRLFDAAAVWCGLIRDTSYEGQAPMVLEAACDPDTGDVHTLPLARDADGLWRTDWSPLLPVLTDGGQPASHRAMTFHRSLATALLHQAVVLREEHGVNAVGLTGGVFQNRLLTTCAADMLKARGFDVYLSVQIPCNDGGISYGQIIQTVSSSGFRVSG
jgi:hydrogenase maturation protein HypF